MSAPAACLYPARVLHRRRIAPRLRFVYRVFFVLVDIDRLDTLGLRLFSHNRWNLLALHDRDYGDGGGLRDWAERLLQAHGVALDGGRIRLLTLPRVLGYAFNPISLWYCEHADGGLRAVIAEVRNTFGEKHCYLLTAASAGAVLPYRQPIDKDKVFHVSPFLERRGRYRFVLGRPGATLQVTIRESDQGRPVLDAAIAARRVPLSDAGLLRQVLAMPWMGVKVVWAIHWQALKLWLRGAPVVRKPAPLRPDVS